ncbi:threonine synthase [Algoriphagus alkaliphilus]|uniref:Threonine synthase n=1 Tax=Algoriphagus alkaliphilus TaxID=279824 RepID=A0A1G5XMT5_9BACT|nr:threonine synthase [Algoriphagus alkaliphilus]SDA71758.1 threonine synthase [Algoriphagus alkaliphilus]
MKYFSTNNPNHKVSLPEAVIKGLAPDNGLYMPERIPVLSEELIEKFSKMSFQEIGYAVIGALFSEDLSESQIRELVDHTLTFDAPLVEVEEDVFSLELFHGPTLAFKDFGARFCSKLMSMLVKKSSRTLRVLVATSGDTGSAVANGFLGVDGVEVIILFPKGKVSQLQEKQFTTLGQNITALEVDGVFDDCQTLVKQAFLDAELNEKLLLTSANSINIARWIPQCLYYFYAFSRLPKTGKKVVFAVPSGNFGNLGAGILAQRMGLPIDRFVAATNVNKVIPDYLNGAFFQAQPSIATVSNSMDVGNPSNFPRLVSLYHGDEKLFRENVKGYFYDDAETVKAIQEIQEKGYILDPHGAVGYLGLKDFMTENSGYVGVFLETAHPGKFRDVVEEALGEKLELPERLAAFLEGEKKVIPMDKSFEEFKWFLEGLNQI